MAARASQRRHINDGKPKFKPIKPPKSRSPSTLSLFLSYFLPALLLLIVVALLAYFLYFSHSQERPLYNRDLVASDLSYEDVLSESKSAHMDRSKRHFNTSVLAYVTPWNSNGYDMAKMFREKFTHVSPVWYQLKCGENVQLHGGHDVDKNWIESVQIKGRPLIFPRVTLEGWPMDTILVQQDERKRTMNIISSECKAMQYDGVVLEAWSAWAATGILDNPILRQKMSLFVGNLSPHVQHRELENAFRRFGRSNLELKDGYGFIVYEDYRDAERALRALQGRSVCGERPSISWAKRHRPFQRFSGKGNSFRRDSLDKDQGQVARRQPSLESDKGSDDDRKGHKVADEVKDISRDNKIREVPAGNIAREEEWNGEEKLAFEEQAKDLDPLDSGRWGEPLSEGSPEHMVGDGSRGYKEDLLDSKEKEDVDDSVHGKSRGSPVDKSLERPSLSFRNSDERFNRRHDALGKPPERCFNCGHLGHVMRQCRLRLKMNTYPREAFDGRRNQFRSLRGIGFRGMGGRFRGMDGPRRVLSRDMEGNYGRRKLRRQGSIGDRRLFKQVEAKSRDKSRRRHHRSDSQRNSPSRDKSKRKHKKSTKKSSHSTRKRRRSSSDSSSDSRSVSQSSSSSPSRPRSRSRSHSHSRSRSSASRLRSSKSRSQSSSSVSHSDRSLSQSSRSRSASGSSRSRSQSGSSRSRKSTAQSHSRSSKSRSRSVSHSPAPRHSPSPDSGVLPSRSSLPLEADSPLSHSNSQERLRSSPKSKADDMAATYTSGTGSERQEKQVNKTVNNAETHKKDISYYSSEGGDMNEQYMKRKLKKRHRFRESKNHNDQNRSDVEELYCETENLSNGGKVSINQEPVMNEHSSRGYEQQDQNTALLGRFVTGQARPKVSEPAPSSFLAGLVQEDLSYSAYSAVIKEGHKGIGHAGDGQELPAWNFDAARLWLPEAMLYRRLKRGPISTANYERRKLQNEEFGIEDKFVRSSSGWWENRSE